MQSLLLGLAPTAPYQWDSGSEQKTELAALTVTTKPHSLAIALLSFVSPSQMTTR